MIIELHNPEQDRMVGQFLQQHGYTAYRFDTFAALSFTFIKNMNKVHPETRWYLGEACFVCPLAKKSKILVLINDPNPL